MNVYLDLFVSVIVIGLILYFFFSYAIGHKPKDKYYNESWKDNKK